MMTRRPRVLKRPRKPKTAMKRLRMMILKIKMRRRKLKTRVMPKRRKVTLTLVVAVLKKQVCAKFYLLVNGVTL